MNKFGAWFLLLCVVVLTGCSESLDSSDDSSSTVGSTSRFIVEGDYLYVVTDKALMAFDVTDSTNVRLRSSQDLGWNIETLFSMDSLLFLGSSDGMYICSLKRPGKPALITKYQHIRSYDPVVVRGNYAFVTLRSDLSWSGVNELQVIDISNLENPVEVATLPMNSPRGLAVTDSLLFVCDREELVVMDAVNPLSMTEKHRFKLMGTLNDVIAYRGWLVLSFSDGLAQFSYANDTIMQVSTLY